MKRNIIYITPLVILAFAACKTGDCRNVPQRPADAPVAEGGSTASGGPASGEQALPPPSQLDPGEPTVEVARPTGQLQCGMAKGATVEETEALLTKSGILVYGSRTADDGLMHMALCGTPTGKVHIFKIVKREQKKAERLGFRTLTNTGNQGEKSKGKIH